MAEHNDDHDCDEQETRKLARKAVRKKFLEELLKCGDISASASVVDVHRNAVYREMKADGRFGRNVEKAREAWHRRQLRLFHKLSKNEWRALAWLLSKRFPDKYGDKTDVSRGENVGTLITPDADAVAMDDTVPKGPDETNEQE